MYCAGYEFTHLALSGSRVLAGKNPTSTRSGGPNVVLAIRKTIISGSGSWVLAILKKQYI